MRLSNLKVALVFDWMTTRGGAERVNNQLYQLFPKADIYTCAYNPQVLPEFKEAKITTSIIQKLPWGKSKPQLYLSLMPYVYEQFDLSTYDLVISSSHSCAKGVITKPETIHVSYCHNPMRYAWDDWQQYIKEYKANPLIKYLARKKIHQLRIWDKLAADRVDHFITNSSTTSQRILKYYRKTSKIIHPSVDTTKFYHAKSMGYYLAVGRLTPYKKFQLLIDAFNENKLPLKIAGSGVLEKELRKQAGPNIEILGEVSQQRLIELYAHCEAFLFPQLEDFGITALEALASGKPVIAYKAGGALDSLEEGKNAVFFKEQTDVSLNKAIQEFQKNRNKFNNSAIIHHSQKFSDHNFQLQMQQYLEKILQANKS